MPNIKNIFDTVIKEGKSKMKSINSAVRYKTLFFSLPKEMGGKEFKKYMFERSKFKPEICKFPAVYIFLSKEGDVLYVGKANSVAERVGNHMSYKSELGVFMDYVHYIILVREAGTKEEKFLIDGLNPIFNTAGSDAKYSFIRTLIISKNPRYRDSIITSLILKDRLQKGYHSSKVTQYAELDSEEEALLVLSILNA